MRMKCIGAQSVPRPTVPANIKGVLAMCRREAMLGEHRTYVKRPASSAPHARAFQLCLF